MIQRVARWAGFVFVSASTLTACDTGRGADPSVDDATRTAIASQNRSLEQAALQGDAAAVAGHYTADATLYGTNGDVHGCAAIEATIRQLYQTIHTDRASLRTSSLPLRPRAVGGVPARRVSALWNRQIPPTDSRTSEIIPAPRPACAHET